jgi:hypothetical protein
MTGAVLASESGADAIGEILPSEIQFRELDFTTLLFNNSGLIPQQWTTKTNQSQQ